jgi:uncharacterized OB-fold protein
MATAVRRDAPTAEFFDGTARGEFLLRHCADCGEVAEPFVVRCPNCESVRLGWRPAGGGAVVVSWAAVHHRAVDGQVRPPTVVAIGQLDEGPQWWAEVTGAGPGDLAVGQRLEIIFEPVPEHETVPAFRRA